METGLAGQKTAALVACHIIWRELAAVLPESPLKVTPVFLPQGLHDQPAILQQKLQAQIDLLDGRYDYILLGYGLCSNGISGLMAQRSKLIVPRAHDCITLILGSKTDYSRLFAAHPGTYWFNLGWLETGSLPGPEWLADRRAAFLAHYEDEDTVDYLIEQDWHWIREYRSIGLIDQPDLPQPAGAKAALHQAATTAAEYLNWSIVPLEGHLSLLRDLVQANWSDDQFLVLNPGERLAPSYDASIIKGV